MTTLQKVYRNVIMKKWHMHFNIHLHRIYLLILFRKHFKVSITILKCYLLPFFLGMSYFWDWVKGSDFSISCLVISCPVVLMCYDIGHVSVVRFQVLIQSNSLCLQSLVSLLVWSNCTKIIRHILNVYHVFSLICGN